MQMKRIKLFAHDRRVNVDGVSYDLSPELWNTIKLDEHIDVAAYDSALNIGEIEWCPNYVTGRKPANERFTKEAWSAYFDQGFIDRALLVAQQCADEAKALADAEEHRRAEEIKELGRNPYHDHQH